VLLAVNVCGQVMAVGAAAVWGLYGRKWCRDEGTVDDEVKRRAVASMLYIRGSGQMLETHPAPGTGRVAVNTGTGYVT
jgi:hypothetical protein